MMTAIALAIAAAVGFACGKVTKQPADAPTADTPSGSHVCVFDTDTFDSGCTFGP